MINLKEDSNIYFNDFAEIAYTDNDETFLFVRKEIQTISNFEDVNYINKSIFIRVRTTDVKNLNLKERSSIYIDNEEYHISELNDDKTEVCILRLQYN